LLFTLACVLGLAAPLAAQSISPGGPVNFGSIAVGSTVKANLTFSAPTATTISSITAATDGVSNLDFLVTQQNCVGSVTSCTIQLTFSPSLAGPRHGYVALLGTTGNVIARAWLTGVGIYGQVSYAPGNIGNATSAAALSPATFSTTSAVADGAGNVFYNDIANSRLLRLSNTGVYTSVAALTGSANSSLAIAGDGTIYASSPTQAVVYAVPPGSAAAAISTGAVALVTPTGLATDGLGNLYIVDAGNNRIVRTALDGSGSAVVTLTGITLSSPAGLAVDAANNLYIVDSGNDRVVVLNLNTNATSIAAITGLTLNNPTGIALDPAGTLYIADTGNKRIVVVPSGGTAFVLNLNSNTLSIPTGVGLLTTGNLILADSSSGLYVVNRVVLTVNFPTATRVGTADTADGFKTFTVQNTGNIVLRWIPQPTTANPAISSANFTDTGGTFTCPNIPAASATSPQLALGASCTYAVEFTPTNTGADTATFTMFLTDAGTSGVSVTPTVTLTGTGTSSLAKFTITATPTSVLVGAPVSFTVTALNSSGATATDYLGTVTFTSTDSTATFLGGTTYTFTSTDAGTRTFSGASAVGFHQFGSFTLSVADNAITAVSNAVQVQAQSAIALTASPNPVAVGSAVTLTATVTSASAGFTRTPTGTVTFTSTPTTGATPVALGTATLNSSGIATLTTSFSTGGTPCITAAYSGDTAFTTVTSTSVCETVGDFSLTLDKSSSANATVVYGQSVSYIFDVAPVGSNTIVSAITISVTGLGIAAPYTVTPTTINTGAGASTVTLTITPTGHQSHQTLALNRIAPITLALLALPFALARRRKFSSFLAALALMPLLIFPVGCSGNSGYFNPAFSLYKITVTAISGSTTHSTVVNLTAE
jgi:hypothetical protein